VNKDYHYRLLAPSVLIDSLPTKGWYTIRIYGILAPPLGFDADNDANSFITLRFCTSPDN